MDGIVAEAAFHAPQTLPPPQPTPCHIRHASMSQKMRQRARPAPSALQLLSLQTSRDSAVEQPQVRTARQEDVLRTPAATSGMSRSLPTPASLDAHASWLDGWFAHTHAHVNVPKTPAPPTATRRMFLLTGTGAGTGTTPKIVAAMQQQQLQLQQQQQQLHASTSAAASMALSWPGETQSSWLANSSFMTTLEAPLSPSASTSSRSSLSDSLDEAYGTPSSYLATPPTLSETCMLPDVMDMDIVRPPTLPASPSPPPAECPAKRRSAGKPKQSAERHGARGGKRRRVQASLDNLDEGKDLLKQLSRQPVDFAAGVEPSYERTARMELVPRDGTTAIAYPDAATMMHAWSVPTASPDVQQRPVDNAHDLYTPHYTRYDGDAREGWCRHCPAHDEEANWYCIKRSQYMYHMQYVHGISSRTRQPYRAPHELVLFNDRNKTTAGLCDVCDGWVTISYGATRKTSWMSWHKHCHRCHKNIRRRTDAK